MSPDRFTVRQLSRHLIDREGASGETPEARAAAVYSACERVYHELSRWVGTHGSLVLFTRALAEARSEHPMLATLSVRTRSEPVLDGVPESIQTHGAAATADALESLLVTLIGLLGRLIGDDMVMRLLDRSVQHDTQEDERLEGGRTTR